MGKRALLIGINRYVIPGADLRGCVNDVSDIREMLTKYCGFSKSNIKIVADRRATKKRMMTEIEKTISKASRGDVVLIHYSGHGSNVPDKSGDEADRRDEILCPTDLDWKDPLLDDWLRNTIDGIDSGVNLTFLMDCCHSGTNTRAFLPPDAKIKERYLPCPLDLFAAESRRELRGHTRSRRKSRKRTSVRNVIDVNIPELLVTGCRDDQTSADALIRGRYNGAMTYSLVRAVKMKKGKLTYRELHREMLAYLRGKYNQVPQLEGKKKNVDRPFLEPY